MIVEKKSPYFWRDSIADAATQYMRLPYRAPILERTIVDALMAYEVFTFGEEVLSHSPFLIRYILPHNHLNPPRVVTSFLVGNAFFALLLGVPAAIVTWITNFFLPGHATSFILGAAFVLWDMNFVFTTIMLPFNIRSGWKTRANTRSLL